MACPRCRTRQLVEIGVTIKDRRVTLHSCSSCETRWWDRDGEQVELGSVLELATVRK